MDLRDEYLGDDSLLVLVFLCCDGVDVSGSRVVVLWVFLGVVGRREFAVERGLELDALVDRVVFEADELVLRVFLDIVPVLTRPLCDPSHFCLVSLGREGVQVVAVGSVGPEVDVQLLFHEDVLVPAAE